MHDRTTRGGSAELARGAKVAELAMKRRWHAGVGWSAGDGRSGGDRLSRARGKERDGED